MSMSGGKRSALAASIVLLMLFTCGFASAAVAGLDGQSVSAFLSGPHSVAIDFDSFGPPSAYDFAFQTAVPEPGCGAVLIGVVGVLVARRARGTWGSPSVRSASGFR